MHCVAQPKQWELGLFDSLLLFWDIGIVLRARSSIFTRGESQSALTTLSVYHIARSFPTKESEYEFFQALDDILRPILKPKGIEWELGIYEASRDLWRVNGLIAPETGSATEKEWFDANRIVNEEGLLKSKPMLEEQISKDGRRY
ncbi:hypothetical protein N7471_001623 [Penicillium samsonianum]|uniref:uncharacterized protein n=1 Tax=Penicillium samsonianum TaxID=1882272 RepID=UPI002547EE1B|nr:uncharacterized protein N7471_001623 [Penicillium samsonianum]KAJ6150424.1 hypothetical protein N7471_001623 [Penicillium samsonianum]